MELETDWTIGGCRRERQKARLALREKDKKVLLLGAGYVSAPVVDYLTRDRHISVTVGKVPCIHRPSGLNSTATVSS